MQIKKITVVGAGKVGTSVVQILAYKNLGDITLVNRTAGKAQGIALDLMESSPVEGFGANITGTDDYSLTKGSDVVVITAGLPRKEGMGRDDLLLQNKAIVYDIAKNLAKYSPNAVIIVVTNPLDAMAYVAWKASGFKENKVVGMAGILDSSRLRYFIAKELNVPPKSVSGMVLGSHGDFMIPVISSIKVNGKPVIKLLSQEKLNQIIQRTIDAGAEIIKLEGDSAFYAPASSVAQMAEAILKDKKTFLPCSAFLNGEYGIKGIFIGVPAMLGKNGIEKIMKLDLTGQELSSLQKSADAIRDMVRKL
ncbi:MAG: malate dehydrogenase [Candidatus Aenigmarchaeota archaeon]|nr:malate dehydrogenase [Candidatus Aenigmarchaeota archaeon]